MTEYNYEGHNEHDVRTLVLEAIETLRKAVDAAGNYSDPMGGEWQLEQEVEMMLKDELEEICWGTR